MAIHGVILDLGHTLMGLDGTWAEIFERGVADLAAFLDSAPAPWPGAGRVAGTAFAQALLERRDGGFARARQTLREVTAEDSMEWTFGHFGLAGPPPELVQGACDAFFAHEERSWHAFPQAIDVLRALTGRGLRLAIFSNATSEPLIQRLVDRFGFGPYADPALTSAGTGIRKPDPQAFEPILSAWGLGPGAVVMVGDTLAEDILGARRAGMRSIWIRGRSDARQEGTSAQAGEREEIRPDRAIAGLEELPGCLDEMDG